MSKEKTQICVDLGGVYIHRGDSSEDPLEYIAASSVQVELPNQKTVYLQELIDAYMVVSFVPL